MQNKITLSFILLLVFSFNTQAQLRFFADFEKPLKTAAFPDNSVNELLNWKSNPKIQYSIEKGPNGTDGIKVLTEGCDANGTTLLPDPRGTNKNWTDVIIELEAVWGDDDDIGIIFRRTSPEKGYIALFGGTQDTNVYLGRLDKPCYKDGVCVFQSCIGSFIAAKPHNIPNFDITGRKIYKIRIEAIEDRITLYFWDIEKLKEKDKPIIDVRDSTYKSGTVGIRPESWLNGLIDNIMVTGPMGEKAVEPYGKLASTWGTLKSAY